MSEPTLLDRLREMTDPKRVGNHFHPLYGEAADTIDALVKALDDLQSAETAYRMVYDLDGYYHQNTLTARGALRSAGYRARDILASVGKALNPGVSSQPVDSAGAKTGGGE